MSLTTRGKKVLGVVALGVAGLVVLAVLLASGRAPEPLRKIAQDIGVVDEEPPTCPLTGHRAPGGEIPDRPVLALKVEESADARPQSGLDAADLVYEQPVEGNITRLIAVFHCRSAQRVGPIRSARFMDVNLLPQFGTPLFGYAGGAPATEKRIAEGDLIDLSYLAPEAAEAYARDAARAAPHDLFTSTGKLWAVTEKGGRTEEPFTFAERFAGGRRSTTIDLPFNASYAHISWRWKRSEQAWVRFIGGAPAVLEDGTQISTQNVIVQEIRQSQTSIVDAAGNASYEVEVIGRGRAFVFRNGKVIQGRWSKESAQAPTIFQTKAGKEIPLTPGSTWIELFGNQTNDLRFVPTLAG